MEKFYYPTAGKLREIFAEHCNLSMEQYEEISEQLIDLVADYQENKPEAEIEKRENVLKTIFDFLFNTKELTLKEYLDLTKCWTKCTSRRSGSGRRSSGRP